MGPDGEAFLTLYESGREARLFTDDGEVLPLKLPAGEGFRYPIVQRFSDGAFLTVEPATSAGEPNASVFSADGTFSHAFYVGDGIQTVLVDPADRIWVGYIDEGVINGLLSKGAQPNWNGLARFDRQGVIDFAFNETLPETDSRRFIDDIYALTVDENGRAWFCPYQAFYLARVEDNDVTYPLERSPAAGADALLVGPDHVAFFNGYHHPGIVTLVELSSQRLRTVQLLGAEGEALSFRRAGVRAQHFVGLDDAHLYRLHLTDLLERLGPWTAENSSTVASALRFQDAAEAHDGGMMLILRDPGEALPEVE